MYQSQIRCSRFCFLSVAIIAGAAVGLANAQQSPPSKQDVHSTPPTGELHTYILPGSEPPILEYLDDPQWTGTGVQHVAPTAGGLSRGFGGIQVNTDANGMNKLNDAANESSIAVDPTAPNRMVIGWRQFDNVNSNFRQAGNAWTNDGGRTWHNRSVFTPGTFRSDPVLAADANGVFYYNSLKGNFAIDIFKSFDGGQNWSTPMPAFGGDKAWMTIDQTNGIGRGNVYQNWSTAAGCCGSRIFTRSTDGGQTWMNPITIPFSPVWGSTTVGPDGTLYIVGFSFNNGNVYVLRSSNAKDPSQTPTFQSTRIDLGGPFNLGGTCDPNPVGLWGQLWIDIDPITGDVYVAASIDPPGADPLDVRIVRSTNGGVSFGPSVRVNDDSLSSGSYQWFGTMSVAPTGRIDIVWNDSRETGICNLSRLYYSSSDDGGQTWTANVAMGPQWDSHIGWPNQNKIGDYYHMKSDATGANLAYAATYNGEQDVYYLRIGDYDCNGNGIADDIDLAIGISSDCNNNGIPDECDIAAGVLDDLNHNGIPDDCECFADCNSDGTVNTLDFLCFLNLWTQQDPAADCNGDTIVNTLDFTCFLNAWNAGCP